MYVPRSVARQERAYYALQHAVYAKLATFYDLLALPLRGLRAEVARLAGAGATTKVLDVCTGTGAQALAFARASGSVVGVDLSPAMLRKARGKRAAAKAQFLEADATALPFEDAAFDVACISFALHEMPLTIRRRVLAEMARVTRADGTILVVDYGLPRRGAWRWLTFHAVKLYERDSYAEFTRADLRAELEAQGIRVGEVRPALRGIAQIVVATNAGLVPARRPYAA
jgi:demethylmenaquinone methyltransferase/2-methoxy-6-polyprenyl-1,4-benzoquinol methylase